MTGTPSASRRMILEAETLLDPACEQMTPGRRPLAVLAFPNSYRTGMASLGFHAVYRILRRHLPNAVDRAFMPAAADLEKLQRGRKPLLTMESMAPLSSARLLAFSLSYELDTLNILQMLRLSGIPLLAAERGEHDPLVAVGGAVPTMNPEPLAPFIDIAFVGDAEAILPGVLPQLMDGGVGREPLLQSLAGVDGIYVPACHPPGRRIRRCAVDETGETRAPAHSFAVTPLAEFGRMLLVETARGCPWNCRFCLVGCAMGRPLWVDGAEIRRTVRGLAGDGWDRAGLVASSAADHPDLETLCRLPLEDGIAISLPSLRASSASATLIRALAAGGQKTLTIAPEAGSQRLRAVIGKKSRDEVYFEFVRGLAAGGDRVFRRLKLYFMMGLPWETDEDVLEIARFSTELARLAAAEVRGLELLISVKPFVPRPHTPFQWAPMLEPARLKARVRLLTRAVKDGGARNLRLQAGGITAAIAQTLLALGGRETAHVPMHALDTGGNWNRAADRAGVDLKRAVFSCRGEEGPYPWEVVQPPVDRESLRRAYDRAAAEAAADRGT